MVNSHIAKGIEIRELAEYTMPQLRLPSVNMQEILTESIEVEVKQPTKTTNRKSTKAVATVK
jgi:hypothetical protein